MERYDQNNLYLILTHRLLKGNVKKYYDRRGLLLNELMLILKKHKRTPTFSDIHARNRDRAEFSTLGERANTSVLINELRYMLTGRPTSIPDTHVFINTHSTARDNCYHELKKYCYSNDSIESLAVEHLMFIPLPFIRSEYKTFKRLIRDSLFSDYPQGWILSRWYHILRYFHQIRDPNELEQELSKYSVDIFHYNNYYEIRDIVLRLQEYVKCYKPYDIEIPADELINYGLSWSVRGVYYETIFSCKSSEQNNFGVYYSSRQKRDIFYTNSRMRVFEYFKERTGLPDDILDVFIDIPPGYIFKIYENEYNVDNTLNGSVEAYILLEWIKHIKFVNKLTKNSLSWFDGVNSNLFCIAVRHAKRLKMFQVAYNKLMEML